MVNQDRAVCPICAGSLAETGTVCPNCGHSLPISNAPGQLPVGTLLQQRFWIGQAIHQDGEGVLYTAKDLQENQRVLVREFYPARLVQRDDALFITPTEDSLLAYKSLLSDFIDIHKIAARLAAGEHVLPQVAIFLENGSGYNVTAYQPISTLEEYMAQNGGTLSWPESKRLILQLCPVVDEIHRLGYIHGGISPQTVCLDEDGVVYLTGFASSALRTDRTEIEEELFSGHSAPEQYSLSSWQGSWTDVYGIAALLYRMLAGEPPEDGGNRRVDDSPVPMEKMGTGLPPSALNAIQRSLSVRPESRIQTVAAFTSGLLYSAEGGTAVFDAAKLPAGGAGDGQTMAFQPMVQDSSLVLPEDRTRRRDGKRTNQSTAKKWVWGLVPLLVVAIGLGVYFLGGQKTDPGPARVAVPDPHYVPPLVGMYIDAVTTNPQYVDQFEFSQKRVYSEQFPAGIVVDQAPSAGVKMIHKGTVILSVSMGSERTTMPTLVGLTVEEARRTLAGTDINYQVVETDEYEFNIVGMTSIGAGSTVRKGKDVVYLYVGKAAPVGEPTENSSSSSSDSD